MNRLKLLREKANMKQSDLGKLLNVKDAAISKYETGKVPMTGDTIIKISHIFHVSADYVLGISDEPNFTYKPDTTSIDILANRLKTLIAEDSHYTINEYAQFAHIKIADFQNYIDGKDIPSSYEICKLVEALDTSADYLFGKSELPHPKKNPSIRWIDNKNFPSRLSDEMDGKFLETELADKLNISISKLKKLLNSEEIPTPYILGKLSDVLEKSTDYLLGLAPASRKADISGHYPFQMDEESITRLQALFGGKWNDQDAEYDFMGLGLTYDEYYMMYHYGFIPHISVLQNICKQCNVSADYLLNISNSKLSIKSSKEYDEDDILTDFRKLKEPYRRKVNGILAEELLQQERDEYMRMSSVAADEKYLDNQGKSSPSSGTGGGTMAV